MEDMRCGWSQCASSVTAVQEREAGLDIGGHADGEGACCSLTMKNGT